MILERKNSSNGGDDSSGMSNEYGVSSVGSGIVVGGCYVLSNFVETLVHLVLGNGTSIEGHERFVVDVHQRELSVQLFNRERIRVVLGSDLGHEAVRQAEIRTKAWEKGDSQKEALRTWSPNHSANPFSILMGKLCAEAKG